MPDKLSGGSFADHEEFRERVSDLEKVTQKDIDRVMAPSVSNADEWVELQLKRFGFIGTEGQKLPFDPMMYQVAANQTESNDWTKILPRLVTIQGAMSRYDGDVSTMRLVHAAMGLDTESGEFMDSLKKHIFYGKPLDQQHLAEELGDLLWYVALACSALDINLDQVMVANIAKLQRRYFGKFSETRAEGRDLEGEKAQLDQHLTFAKTHTKVVEHALRQEFQAAGDRIGQTSCSDPLIKSLLDLRKIEEAEARGRVLHATEIPEGSDLGTRTFSDFSEGDKE